jgi:hypothetical protein
MMEDKKIERLFQEKFKDFETQPSPLVWENIESKLTQKKKRRILPIWWFTSGVASLFIIGLLLFPEIDIISKENPIEVNSKKPSDTKKTNIITTEVETTKNQTNNKELIESKTVSLSNSKNTSTNENLMVSTKIENEEKKLPISTVSLKGLQVDKKIAMENILIQPLTLKTQEREIERKDFIAEVTQNEETKEDKIVNNKWSVSPVLGILTSQSFTKTSAIDSNFNENNVSSPGTISYGISFAYEINEKLSLKSGIQVQNMSFDTENVVLVSNSTVSNNLENISFSSADNFLYISPLGTEEFDAILANNSANSNEATLEQDFNYIEFPLELKYQLFSSGNIETSLISGFSTLFLTENNITANSSNFNEKIGEANNLNNINFSANLGIDVEFNLSKKVKLNINPMLKTQLNTFSTNSTNFKPYIIGIYSGFRYNF